MRCTLTTPKGEEYKSLLCTRKYAHHLSSHFILYIVSINSFWTSLNLAIRQSRAFLQYPKCKPAHQKQSFPGSKLSCHPLNIICCVILTHIFNPNQLYSLDDALNAFNLATISSCAAFLLLAYFLNKSF